MVAAEVTPGPSQYPIHEINHKGQMRSFLGGKIPPHKPVEPDFVTPGPNQYSPEIQEHVTGYKIMAPSQPKKAKKIN